jgi:hypothetical protein
LDIDWLTPPERSDDTQRTLRCVLFLQTHSAKGKREWLGAKKEKNGAVSQGGIKVKRRSGAHLKPQVPA